MKHQILVVFLLIALVGCNNNHNLESLNSDSSSQQICNVNKDTFFDYYDYQIKEWTTEEWNMINDNLKCEKMLRVMIAFTPKQEYTSSNVEVTYKLDVPLTENSKMLIIPSPDTLRLDKKNEVSTTYAMQSMFGMTFSSKQATIEILDVVGEIII